MSKRLNGEGTIYKREDGRWCAAYYDKNFKRHYLYGKTQSAVKKRLKEKMAELEKENDEIENEKTLQEWVAEYLETYKKNEIKESTFGTYMLYYRKHILNSDIGKCMLSELTLDRMQLFYNSKVNEGYNSKTVRHIHSIINSSLEMAVRLHMIRENCNAYVSIPRKKKYETVPLTSDEVHTILTEASDEEIYPIVLLGMLCGMRKGEIMGLKWSEVDFDNRVIMVKASLCKVMSDSPNEQGHYATELKILDPKNKSSIRTIPMMNEVYEALKRHKRNQEVHKAKIGSAYFDQNLVFTDELGGFLPDRQFADDFHKFLDKYHIQRVRFHDLRHTFASLLIKENVSLRVIQDLLGHSSITTSMDIYGHISEDEKVDAVATISTIMGEND